MTRNIKIAEIMGWELVDYLDPSLGKHWANKNGEYICDHLQFRTYLPHAKLLQAKMVADGWHIVIAQHSPDCFSATAWKDIFEDKKYITEIEHYVQRANTEPAALVALFVKVYNIGGE